MQRIVAFLICTYLACPAFGQKIPKKIQEKSFSIGKTIQIQSSILGEVRELNIYLPANYDTNHQKRYPVIYLLDGSADEDFIHISGLVQFATFPWINKIPESIVVGIANVDRKRDFTYPSSQELDRKEFPTSGGSAKFMTFLGEELQPFIKATFRTTETKTLIGQSLGGLLATEILFKKPHLFDKYVIVSPSLWWDDEALLKFEPTSYGSQKLIFVAVGKEGEVMERTAEALYLKLKALETEKSKVFFEFFEDKSHGDALHEAVYHAFEKLFSVETQ